MATKKIEQQATTAPGAPRLENQELGHSAGHLLQTGFAISGASAGDLHGAVMREVRVAAERDGDPLAGVKVGLEKLQSLALLTEREVRELTRVCGLIFAVAHEERTANEICDGVRSYHQGLVTGQDASPVALALASLATDAAITMMVRENQTDGKVSRAAKSGSNTVDASDVGGAVAGAVGGGIIGGVGGAIAGAVLGGIGASAVAIFSGGKAQKS